MKLFIHIQLVQYTYAPRPFIPYALTDSESKEGKEGNGMVTESPTQRPFRRLWMRRIHLLRTLWLLFAMYGLLALWCCWRLICQIPLSLWKAGLVPSHVYYLLDDSLFIFLRSCCAELHLLTWSCLPRFKERSRN